MDQQEIRTLRILEEIVNEDAPSQRDLSRKLNISLGLVNTFVKRLAKKGYFKITTIPKNRVRYLLTPKGAAEKTRLTYEYIQSSMSFYKNARSKVHKLLLELQDSGVRKIVFCGVSELSEISYLLLQDTVVKLVGIVDDRQRNNIFLKKEVVGTDQLQYLSYDLILITDINEPLSAYDNLIASGIPREKIVMI